MMDKYHSEAFKTKFSVDQIVSKELKRVSKDGNQHNEDKGEDVQAYITELDRLISKLEGSIHKLQEHQSQLSIDDTTSSQMISDFGFSSEFTYK